MNNYTYIYIVRFFYALAGLMFLTYLTTESWGICHAQQTTHAYQLEVCFNCEQNVRSDDDSLYLPYTFLPEKINSNFYKALFRQWRSGRLPVYRDAAMTDRITCDDLKNSFHLLANINRKDIYNSQPAYTIEIGVSEIWQYAGDSLQSRYSEYGILWIYDPAKKKIPPLKVFFPKDAFGKLPWQYYQTIFKGYQALENIPMEEIIRNFMYNFVVVRTNPHQKPDKNWGVDASQLFQRQYQKHLLAKTRKLPTIRTYEISIPFEWNENSMTKEYAELQQYSLLENAELYRQLVPRLMQLILQKKCKLHYFDDEGTSFPVEAVIERIEAHPDCPEKITRS